MFSIAAVLCICNAAKGDGVTDKADGEVEISWQGVLFMITVTLKSISLNSCNQISFITLPQDTRSLLDNQDGGRYQKTVHLEKSSICHIDSK